MPPFRSEKILVDPLFDGEMLHELRDIGYGHEIVIVNVVYDTPRDARVVRYPGSTADAYLGIATLVPIEEQSLVMEGNPEGPDKGDDELDEVADKLRELSMSGWARDFSPDLVWADNGEKGFRDHVGEKSNTLFVRTIDELPFACVSLTVANPQLSEDS
jgi:hypothetical protein